MLGFRHVTNELSAYYHGQLAPEEARRVAGHLEGCPDCRKEFAEIRAGAELAAHLSAAPAPDSLWPAIERRLDEAEPAPGVHGGLWQRPAFALTIMLLVAAAAVTTWYPNRERLRLEAAAAPPSTFEADARAAHHRRLAGELPFEFASTAPQALRGWVEQRSGIEVKIAQTRPAEDHGRFQLLGARIITAGGAPAAMIGYTIDARPVTLVTARLRDLRDAPRDPWFRKEISIRAEAATGEKTLTWATDGQAYVLISDLPENALQSCFICHTTSERRELIRQARVRPQT